MLQTALDLSAEVRDNERAVLERQRKKKRVKKEALLKTRWDAATIGTM